MDLLATTLLSDSTSALVRQSGGSAFLTLDIRSILETDPARNPTVVFVATGMNEVRLCQDACASRIYAAVRMEFAENAAFRRYILGRQSNRFFSDDGNRR